MSTIEEQIKAAESELSRLEERLRSYGGGDRPMSPPVALMRQGHNTRRWLEDLRAQRAAENLPERLCVVALVTNDDRVLLVKPKKRGRAFELPGGGVEAGEVPSDAVRRELREETGIRIMLTGRRDEVRGVPKPGAEYASRIFIYYATGGGIPAPRNKSEIDTAGWFPRAEVLRLHATGQLSDLASREHLLKWATTSACRSPLAILAAAEELDVAIGLDGAAFGREAAEALCAALGGEAGRWLREHLDVRRILGGEEQRTPLDRATVRLAAVTRERLKSIGQLFGIAPNRIIDDISVGEALQRRERERYELGLRHGATLRGARAVAAGVPLDVLARALWNAVDRGETSFEDLAAEHAERTDEASPLSIVRAEASSVRSAILDHLAAAEKRVEDVDASTAWGRLEALVKAGPVELRAAWRAWEIAREAEPATGPEADEDEARVAGLWEALDLLGVSQERRDKIQSYSALQATIKAFAKAPAEPPMAAAQPPAEPPPALRHAMRSLAAAIDESAQSIGAMLREPALIQGARRAVAELEQAPALAARVRGDQTLTLTPPRVAGDDLGPYTPEEIEALAPLVEAWERQPPTMTWVTLRRLGRTVLAQAAALSGYVRERETYLSEHRDLRYPAPMPGTEPEPGLELLPVDLSVRAAVTPWTDLADGPHGGKLIPVLSRGETVFFTGPDSGAWGAERAKDGSLTLMMPRAKVDLEARALLQRARIRLVEEPDSTKLHAEIDAFLAPQANAAAPEALRLAQALREAPDDLLLEIAPAIEAALDVVRARRSP